MISIYIYIYIIKGLEKETGSRAPEVTRFSGQEVEELLKRDLPVDAADAAGWTPGRPEGFGGRLG